MRCHAAAIVQEPFDVGRTWNCGEVQACPAVAQTQLSVFVLKLEQSLPRDLFPVEY